MVHNTFYRSEQMAYCELFLQSEIAYACIAELGDLALTQFTDLNGEASAYQRKYVRELRECDEMERQLRFLETELAKENIRVPFDVPSPPTPSPKDLQALRKKISNAEKQLTYIRTSSLEVRLKQYELLQIKHLLELTDSYFADNQGSDNWENVAETKPTDSLTRSAASTAQQIGPRSSAAIQQRSVGSTDGLLVGNLRFICGIVAREKAASLERMLWRISRGNALFRSMVVPEDIENPNTGQKEQLNVFIVVFQGDALQSNLLKVCSAYHANIFKVSEHSEERTAMRAKMLTRLEDMKLVLNEGNEQRQKLLQAVKTEHRAWTIQLRKAKTVYHHLNMLNPDVTNKYLIGEFWCPEQDYGNIENTLRSACEKHEGSAGIGVLYFLQRLEKMPKKVPTFYRTNKFTRGFNSLVAAYGIARYQEINPALYATILFPFLFAVMFGDIGHGIIVTAFGLFLVVREKKLQPIAERQESFKMIFGGRYIILLMGIFSIYTGAIYNDIFSKALNIFQSKWHSDFEIEELKHHEHYELTAGNGTHFHGWPYPFGLDPIWLVAENKIIFINGFKMKISVIVGVVHMIFGLILSLMNHLYFRNWVNVFCEFVPQMLFICCLFGYMDALIFYKWISFNADSSASAPSILIGLINMCLFRYSEETLADKWIMENVMKLQYALVVIALISIPWMLLIKPLILRHQNNVKVKDAHRSKVEATARATATAQNTAANQAATQGAANQSFELAERRGLQAQASVISSVNLPIRSRTNTVASRGARKSITSNTTNDFGSISSDGDEDGSSIEGEKEEDEEKFAFGEVFMHQAIHTIEYVLGLISHTASYLRLWALSLAHAELSEVLWSMVFRRALSMASSDYTGCVAIFIIFTAWAALTIAILCLMEGLSAFLHALRLQWIEFQSKFYGGDGIAFQPYSFKLAYRVKSD